MSYEPDQPTRSLRRQFATIFYALGLGLYLSACSTAPTTAPQTVQFVFTSDAHYGITREAFRGDHKVPGATVNGALVASLNALPGQVRPADDGVSAAEPIDAIDFVVEGGDIANRQEAGIQPAATSWKEFAHDYIDTLALRTSEGKPAGLFMLPGNHDITNALGFFRPMTPATDASSMAQIYNRTVHPVLQRTADTYSYQTDKILYSKDIGGIHFVFTNVWPDSVARRWLDSDLDKVSASTPVLLFTHAPPDVEARFFINPNGDHSINASDKFENLVADTLASVDTQGRHSIQAKAVIEQQALADFIKRHRNIVAYFHGHENYHQAYVWHGPNNDVALPVFRVDSPMKGNFSAKDEHRLSYQLVSIDPKAHRMTVREYLWNAPAHWGASTTIDLRPRLQ